MSDNVLKTGVKGSDNCPICGRTMKRVKDVLCGRPYWVLVCRQRDDHSVTVRLVIDDNGET